MDGVTGVWAIALAVVGAIGTIGGMGGLVALFNANAVRRRTDAETISLKSASEKTDADAADKITDTALKLIAPLEREVQRQAAVINQQQAAMSLTQTQANQTQVTLSQTQARVGQLESDARTQHLLLVEHSVWDHLALMTLKENGVNLPPIPPLFPPSAVQVATTETHAQTTTTSTES